MNAIELNTAQIKHIIFTGWHFMRWLRLGFAVLFIVQTFQTHEAISGVVAAFFLFQAVTNIGCCSAKGCTVNLPAADIKKQAQTEEYRKLKK